MTALPDWTIASDAEVTTAAAAGDRDAFAQIYDRYADRLHDFCVGMLRNRDTAADCVQDVFCIAATRLGQLKDPDKLRPWLYSIARNEALRSIRNANREKVYDELPEAMSDEPGPETLAARSALAELVAEAAGGLSDRDRSVLELSYRHGLDGPELAEALGVSHANAKKLVQRMRDTIEKSLGALLVARRAGRDCPDLAAILDGWDGRFSVLMRKRIARHIESCPNCDRERDRLVTPAALLGAVPVFIPAPLWLRGRTLDRIQLPSPAQNGSAADDSDARSTRGHRRAAVTAAVVAAIVMAGAVVTMSGLLSRSPAVDPATHTGPVPASTSASLLHSPDVITAPREAPSPTVQPRLATSSEAPPQPSTTPPVAGPVATTTAPAPTSAPTLQPSQPSPVPTTVPPTTVPPTTVTQITPTFTVPTSSNPPTSAPPPTSVVKPTPPVFRPTAIKPIPVTTTPPVLQ